MKRVWRNLAGVALAMMMVSSVLAPAALRAQEQPESARTSQAVQTSPKQENGTQENGAQEKDENDAYRHSAMVGRLGGMMGMSPERAATAFEWANFLVLAAAVLYGVFKAMPKVLRDRSSAIQKKLVDARTATEEASGRLNAVEDRLAALDGQIAEMRTQAEQDAARDEARMKASVEDETKKILASAEQEIASATVQAQKALQQYAAELAIEQAARKLTVSAETDRLLVQSFANRLAGDESKKGQN